MWDMDESVVGGLAAQKHKERQKPYTEAIKCLYHNMYSLAWNTVDVKVQLKPKRLYACNWCIVLPYHGSRFHSEYKYRSFSTLLSKSNILAK